MPIMFSALLTLCLYNANDVTSKSHYSSVISFLLNGFITLLRCVLCDKLLNHCPEELNKTGQQMINSLIIITNN